MRILKEHNLDILMDNLVAVASNSTCKRSKCGSIICRGDITTEDVNQKWFGEIIGRGYNSMPCGEDKECFKDNLSPTFKSDKTCCVHAEQRAIMDALTKENGELIIGSTLFFIRLDENDQPKHSGDPYCSICSKMALASGVSQFVLWHKQGWTAYDTKEYNDLTFKFK